METEAQGGKNLYNVGATRSEGHRQTDALPKKGLALSADCSGGEGYFGEQAALLVQEALTLKQPDPVSSCTT